VKLFAGKFDDSWHIMGVHLCGFCLLHFADDLRKPRFFHGGAHGVLNFHDKGFVLGVQGCLRVDAEIFLAVGNTAYVVATGCGFIHDHAVAAYQPINQRLDADRAKPDLAVADDDPGLHNVAGGYLRLQAGVHGLDVHTAFGDLAAFKADVRQPAENRQRHSGNVDIVDATIAIAQRRAGGTVRGVPLPAFFVLGGSVVTGKSTFLQTLIYSLAVKYSPNVVNFYILDFSSGMLSSFEKLPHTGGVLRENDVEKIGKFFSMIKGIIDERKKLFNGGNYRQYVKVHGTKIPSIVIVIDNFAGFKEKTENAYEDTLIHLSREGVGYGIFLALSSAGFGMAEIQNRIGDNIRTVVSLEMGDKFKYMDVMRATHIDVIPESGIKGRGIAFVEGRLLEFQTALAIDAEDDYKRNAKIEAMSQKMRDMWDGNTAKQIPFIPENPVFDDLKNLDEYSVAVSNKRLIPFAYNYVDASVYSIDLADTYCCSISGKRRTGKTNLLKLLMYAVSQKNGKGVVIEKESNELKLLSSELGFEYIDSDKGVFDYFKSITDEFVARNKYKHTLEEDGLSDLQIYEKMSVKEPMFIFISDITKFIDCVYHPEGNITNMSGYFENIIEKGSLHNIYFFACINTDNLASAAGSNLYRLFTGYKTGVHLGGNVASQRIFNFQNIHYSQMSKSSKKGHALTPSKDDDTTALKIIVPLFGSREE